MGWKQILAKRRAAEWKRLDEVVLAESGRHDPAPEKPRRKRATKTLSSIVEKAVLQLAKIS